MGSEFKKLAISLTSLVEEAKRDRKDREVLIVPSNQSEILATAMEEAGIPVQTVEGIIYDEKRNSGDFYTIDLTQINITDY